MTNDLHFTAKSIYGHDASYKLGVLGWEARAMTPDCQFEIYYRPVKSYFLTKAEAEAVCELLNADKPVPAYIEGCSVSCDG